MLHKLITILSFVLPSCINLSSAKLVLISNKLCNLSEPFKCLFYFLNNLQTSFLLRFSLVYEHILQSNSITTVNKRTDKIKCQDTGRRQYALKSLSSNCRNQESKTQPLPRWGEGEQEGTVISSGKWEKRNSLGR